MVGTSCGGMQLEPRRRVHSGGGVKETSRVGGYSRRNRIFREGRRCSANFRRKTMVSHMNGRIRNTRSGASVAVSVREGVLPRRDDLTQLESERFALGEVWRILRRELAAAFAACGMFEYVALGYLGISSSLIVLFAENLAH